MVGIQNTLKLFYTLRPLVNSAKNEMFSIEINREELEEIQQRVGFKFGSLPLRYVPGVP